MLYLPGPSVQFILFGLRLSAYDVLEWIYTLEIFFFFFQLPVDVSLSLILSSMVPPPPPSDLPSFILLYVVSCVSSSIYLIVHSIDYMFSWYPLFQRTIIPENIYSKIDGDQCVCVFIHSTVYIIRRSGIISKMIYIRYCSTILGVYMCYFK